MDCRVVNMTMKTAADNIKKSSENLKTAGDTFVTAFLAAIADMRGEAKEELEDFFNASYKELVSSQENGIPGMVQGLGDLLDMNRTQFAATDHGIAEQIRKLR